MMPPLQRGEAVVLDTAERRLVGVVVIASANGRALVIELEDGMIGGWVDQVPLLEDEGGRWATLNGVPLTLARL